MPPSQFAFQDRNAPTLPFSDYAKSSPIEPSVAGGGKIARAIGRVVTDHDFVNGGCRVYV